MDVTQQDLAQKILDAVASEAWRIEQKFSRYRDDNIIYRINFSDGKPVQIDAETLRLLRFADELYDMSEGLFDITSGVLRKVWKFDGSDKLPSQESVEAIVQHVGWHRVELTDSTFMLPAGMEIDLGGIGKEYAVDRCAQIAGSVSDKSVLINFGGDLCVTHARENNGYWSVGRLITGSEAVADLFELRQGAIATSGDANRYLLKDKVRYSHVLNPKTGWPVAGAPHTVSVAAPSCTEAGMLSTLAMLQGVQARQFLEAQGVTFCIN